MKTKIKLIIIFLLLIVLSGFVNASSCIIRISGDDVSQGYKQNIDQEYVIGGQFKPVFWTWYTEIGDLIFIDIKSCTEDVDKVIIHYDATYKKEREDYLRIDAGIYHVDKEFSSPFPKYWYHGFTGYGSAEAKEIGRTHYVTFSMLDENGLSLHNEVNIPLVVLSDITDPELSVTYNDCTDKLARLDLDVIDKTQVKYEIDWDSDGNFETFIDYSDEQSPSLTHKYNFAETYTATIRVTDSAYPIGNVVEKKETIECPVVSAVIGVKREGSKAWLATSDGRDNTPTYVPDVKLGDKLEFISLSGGDIHKEKWAFESDSSFGLKGKINTYYKNDKPYIKSGYVHEYKDVNKFGKYWYAVLKVCDSYLSCDIVSIPIGFGVKDKPPKEKEPTKPKITSCTEDSEIKETCYCGDRLSYGGYCCRNNVFALNKNKCPIESYACEKDEDCKEGEICSVNGLCAPLDPSKEKCIETDPKNICENIDGNFICRINPLHNNPYIKASILSSPRKYDECVNENTVREWYCDNGGAVSEDKGCGDLGCDDGACGGEEQLFFTFKDVVNNDYNKIKNSNLGLTEEQVDSIIVTFSRLKDLYKDSFFEFLSEIPIHIVNRKDSETQSAYFSSEDDPGIYVMLDRIIPGLENYLGSILSHEISHLARFHGKLKLNKDLANTFYSQLKENDKYSIAEGVDSSMKIHASRSPEEKRILIADEIYANVASQIYFYMVLNEKERINFIPKLILNDFKSIIKDEYLDSKTGYIISHNKLIETTGEENYNWHVIDSEGNTIFKREVDEVLTEKNKEFIENILKQSIIYSKINNLPYPIYVAFGISHFGYAETITDMQNRFSEILFLHYFLKPESDWLKNLLLDNGVTQEQIIRSFLTHESVHAYFSYKYKGIEKFDTIDYSLEEGTAYAIQVLEILEMELEETKFFDIYRTFMMNHLQSPNFWDANHQNKIVNEETIKKTLKEKLSSEDYEFFFEDDGKGTCGCMRDYGFETDGNECPGLFTHIKKEDGIEWCGPELYCAYGSCSKTLETQIKAELIWPVDIDNELKINSCAGKRSITPTDASTEHEGIDIDGVKGENVYAVYDGNITDVGDYDHEVKMEHIDENGKNFITRYIHLDKIDWMVGNVVSQGQKIGTVGTWGKGQNDKWEPHLHFEIWTNKKWSGYAHILNPLNYLPTLDNLAYDDNSNCCYKQKINEPYCKPVISKFDYPISVECGFVLNELVKPDSVEWTYFDTENIDVIKDPENSNIIYFSLKNENWQGSEDITFTATQIYSGFSDSFTVTVMDEKTAASENAITSSVVYDVKTDFNLKKIIDFFKNIFSGNKITGFFSIITEDVWNTEPENIPTGVFCGTYESYVDKKVKELLGDKKIRSFIDGRPYGWTIKPILEASVKAGKTDPTYIANLLREVDEVSGENKEIIRLLLPTILHAGITDPLVIVYWIVPSILDGGITDPFDLADLLREINNADKRAYNILQITINNLKDAGITDPDDIVVLLIDIAKSCGEGTGYAYSILSLILDAGITNHDDIVVLLIDIARIESEGTEKTNRALFLILDTGIRENIENIPSLFAPLIPDNGIIDTNLIDSSGIQITSSDIKNNLEQWRTDNQWNSDYNKLRDEFSASVNGHFMTIKGYIYKNGFNNVDFLILASKSSGMPLEYLTAMAYQEGYRYGAQDTFAIPYSHFDEGLPMGVDFFFSSLLEGSLSEYIRKDYQEITDYLILKDDSGNLVMVEHDESGEPVIKGYFRGPKQVLEAMAALYYYNLNKFLRDAQELGIDISRLTEDQKFGWAYIYYNGGGAKGKKLLEDFGLEGLEYNKEQVRNANRILNTVHFNRMLHMFDSSSPPNMGFIPDVSEGCSINLASFTENYEETQPWYTAECVNTGCEVQTIIEGTTLAFDTSLDEFTEEIKVSACNAIGCSDTIFYVMDNEAALALHEQEQGGVFAKIGNFFKNLFTTPEITGNVVIDLNDDDYEGIVCLTPQEQINKKVQELLKNEKIKYFVEKYKNQDWNKIIKNFVKAEIDNAEKISDLLEIIERNSNNINFAYSRLEELLDTLYEKEIKGNKAYDLLKTIAEKEHGDGGISGDYFGLIQAVNALDSGNIKGDKAYDLLKTIAENSKDNDMFSDYNWASNIANTFYKNGVSGNKVYDLLMTIAKTSLEHTALSYHFLLFALEPLDKIDVKGDKAYDLLKTIAENSGVLAYTKLQNAVNALDSGNIKGDKAYDLLKTIAENNAETTGIYIYYSYSMLRNAVNALDKIDNKALVLKTIAENSGIYTSTAYYFLQTALDNYKQIKDINSFARGYAISTKYSSISIEQIIYLKLDLEIINNRKNIAEALPELINNYLLNNPSQSNKISVLINRLHNNDEPDDLIRKTIAQNLDLRSIYYLMSIGGADLYTSTFEKLYYYNLIQGTDYPAPRFSNWLNEIRNNIDPNKQYTLDFILTLSNYNKLKDVINSDPDFFMGGIKSAMQEKDDSKLKENSVKLVSTIHEIFTNPSLIQFKGDDNGIENFLLSHYYINSGVISGFSENKIRKAIFGFNIKLNKEHFDDKQKAIEISNSLPKIIEPTVPKEWLGDNILTAKLYFTQREWLPITKDVFFGTGAKNEDGTLKGYFEFKEIDSLPKDKPYNERHTFLLEPNIESNFYQNRLINGIKLRVILTTELDDLASAAASSDIDIIIHRGHSFSERDNFIPRLPVSDVQKLIQLGGCGGFGRVASVQEKLPLSYYFSDENIGEGADNTRILFYVMRSIAQRSNQEKITWNEIEEDVIKSYKKVGEYPSGIIYPHRKSLLLNPFIRQVTTGAITY